VNRSPKPKFFFLFPFIISYFIVFTNIPRLLLPYGPVGETGVGTFTCLLRLQRGFDDVLWTVGWWVEEVRLKDVIDKRGRGSFLFLLPHLPGRFCCRVHMFLENSSWFTRTATPPITNAKSSGFSFRYREVRVVSIKNFRKGGDGLSI